MSGAWILLRPRPEDGLPALAYALLAWVGLTAASVMWRLWHVEDPVYPMLAVGLGAVLVVPLVALAGAAARLLVQRRHVRLSTLRLLGARDRTVRGLASGEAAIAAVLGCAAGLAGHLLTAPAIALLPLRGAAAGTPLPWWAALAVCVLILLLALQGSAAGLRRVLVTPLGVRTRRDPSRVGWRGLVAGLALCVVAVATLQGVSAEWGALLVALAITASLSATMAALGLVGPPLVSAVARFRLRRAGTAEGVLAVRSVLEAPRAAWRQVSGVALAMFVAVPAGVVMGYLDLIARESPVVDDALRATFGDVRTVAGLALGLAFAMAAGGVLVSQAAALVARHDVLVGLDRLGMPRWTMTRARMRAMLGPLAVALIAPTLAVTLVGPMFVASVVIVAPMVFLTLVGVVAAGTGLVLLAVVVTHPLMIRLLAHPERAV